MTNQGYLMAVKYGYKYDTFNEHGFQKHIFSIYEVSDFGHTNRFSVKFQSGGDFKTPYGGTILDLSLSDFDFAKKFFGNGKFYFLDFRIWMRLLQKRRATRLVYDIEKYELVKRKSK